jgi:glycosyltransferase involved in cell wall biosynthesis
MKIGVDATCWGNKRGYGRFTRELLDALVRVDKTNEYFFFVDNETAAANKLPASVRTVVAQTSASPSKAAAAGGSRSLGDIWSMSRSVMRHPVDIFFFPTMYSYFPIFNRTRVVVTLHDMIADNYPRLTFPDAKSRLFWRLKQRVAVSQASMIATVSDYSKSQIMSHFKLPRTRLRLISEAAQPIFAVKEAGSDRYAVLSRYGLDAADEFLLYVGGISPHKNLSKLVEAFDRILKKSNRGVKLVLVGDYKDDPFFSAYPSLRDQIAELGIGQSVIFTGFVPDDDLVHLYNAATLLVLPSLDEGFGLPAIEAMSCGTPVASSDCGSLPEVLGEAGTYFNPLNAADIASVIGSLLNNATRRAELGELGIQRSRLFRWERAAEQTLSIFNELEGLTPKHG